MGIYDSLATPGVVKPSIYDNLNVAPAPTPAAPATSIYDGLTKPEGLGYVAAPAVAAVKGAVEGFNATPTAPKDWNVVNGAVNAFSDAIKQGGKSLSDNFDTMVSSMSSSPTGTLGLKGDVALAQGAVGVVGSIFGALLSPLQGLAHIPILGTAVDGVNKIFSAIGEGAGQAAVQVLHETPLPQETKTILQPLVHDATALVSQIYAGKAGGDAYAALKDKAIQITDTIHTQMQGAKAAIDTGPVRDVPVAGESVAQPVPMEIKSPSGTIPDMQPIPENISAKMVSDFTPPDIKIGKGNTEPDYINTYGGQLDGYFPAFDKVSGKKIGFVDFSNYEGTVEIRKINVDPQYRGKGIGTALVSAVQKEFPQSKLQWSFMTKDGEALKASYEKSLSKYTTAPPEPPPMAADSTANATKLAELRQYQSFLKDAIDNHPGKDLIKYASTVTGELPEIAKGATSKFGKSGDVMLQDLLGQDASGNGSIDVGNKRLAEYRAMKAQEASIAEQIRTLTPTVRDEAALNKASILNETRINKLRGAQPALPEEATTNRLQQVQGTGEVKANTLGQGIEAKAIENKITAGFGDLPSYKTVSIADQAERALKYLNENPNGARAVAFGRQEAPAGLLPESILVAVERRAISEGDVSTMRMLANSNLVSEATTMGQRIRTLAERDPTSPVGAIKDVQDARASALKAKGVDIAKEVAKETSDIKSEIARAVSKSRPSWESFITSITCGY